MKGLVSMKVEGTNRVSNGSGRSASNSQKYGVQPSSAKESAREFFGGGRDSFEHSRDDVHDGILVDTGELASKKAELAAKLAELKTLTDHTLRAQAYTVQYIKGDIDTGEFIQKYKALYLKPIDENLFENSKKLREMIAKYGFWGAENTSKRMIDIALRQGVEFSVLKSAVESGFKQAESRFGAKLPDVCVKAYKLVLAALDSPAENSPAPNL